MYEIRSNCSNIAHFYSNELVRMCAVDPSQYELAHISKIARVVFSGMNYMITVTKLFSLNTCGYSPVCITQPNIPTTYAKKKIAQVVLSSMNYMITVPK